ncbi:IpaB/EvcA family protein [Fructilactobacillus carniphilus]|uniref:IpaB/EvcA family protein n=1 Tax=Fructilactobacillus carniphilus TaxID=2940297 RepID=A0ABY5BXS9_9LACO|nr:IpaB/EvcA family protein [Fructilactobacillus carniphilus]USS90168.1 IpaB/EvcA family protein [Fructilactobacillus carniphilus]
MANDVNLNPAVQNLLNTVARFFEGDVQVQIIGDLKSGYLRHDQVQTMQDGQHLFVQLSDVTDPDFLASHELLHVLMTLRGFPQVYFPLTTGDEQLDEQLRYVGTDLFDTVSHFVVYAEQRKHGLIDETVEEAVVKGVRQTITPEQGQVDAEMITRLVTVLDALVFLGDHFEKYRYLFDHDFPIATKAAEQLYQLLTKKPTDSPFALRRNVVKLFRAFDQQLQDWDLPALHLNDFAMVTSVFSKRQLGLQVKQVFKLYYSELRNRKTGKRAYVGFTISDDQNSLVMDGPVGEKVSVDHIQSLYQKTVQELFDELHIPYLER